MFAEERKEALLRSIRRLAAYQEIQNEMGRMIAAFNFRQAERVLWHFALEEADVSLEVADEGVFSGREAVETFVGETVGSPALKGEMIDIQLTTPIVEVAGDGRTARGLWWCPGAGAAVPGGLLPGAEGSGEPRAIWLWGNIAADFLFTESEWKIWHLHYFRVIRCSYEKGWVRDVSMIHRPNTAMHPLSRPTTWHNPYSPNAVRCGIPAPPFSYETWEDDNWMLRSDKTK